MKRAKITKRPYTYKVKSEDRWVVTYSHKGKRPEKWFKTRREAEAHAAEVDRKMTEGVFGKSNVTFAFVCEAWLKRQERRADLSNKNADLTKGSLYGKQSDAKVHLIPFFGSMKLDEIDAAVIRRFVEEQAGNFAHWTARRRRNLVKQILDYAVEHEHLGVNPMTGKRITVPGEIPVREDVPEVEVVAQLFDVLLNKPRPWKCKLDAWQGMKIQTVLIGLMGFRPGEVGGLHWENVDLDQWKVTISKGLTWHDGLKAPKTRQSVRTLDLDPITHRVLTEHAEWTSRATHRRARRHLKGYVVVTGQTGRVMPTTMRFRHHRAMQLAGLVGADGASDFTLHALRHFAGSLWLAQGMQLKDVSWRLGHKTTTVTEKVYLHQLKHDERAKQIVARLNTAFPKIAIPSASMAIAPPEEMIVEIEPDPVPPPPPMLPPPPTPPLVASVPRLKADGYTLRQASHGKRPRSLEDAPRWLDDALDLLDQGCTLVEIAHRLKRGVGTVANWLEVAGVASPGRHAAQVRAAHLEAKFAEMSAQGWRVLDIAYQCKCSRVTVEKWLRRQGENAGKTPVPVAN